MYKNIGFEIYGTKKHALKYGDGTYADEYSMCLFLNGNKTEEVKMVKRYKIGFSNF